MKKTLVALAALAVVGAASAQSTVTLFGSIDASVGVRELKQTGVFPGSAASDVGPEVMSGQQNGSRWGMRGTEDLGGGMKANFNVTNGFNVDTGTAAQGGLFFGREAWVGLSGGFGAITFGRQVTILANGPWAITGGYANYDAWASTTNNGGFGNAASIATDNVRKNSSVQYQTPAMGGFVGTVMWAPGENGISGGANNSNRAAAQRIAARTTFTRAKKLIGKAQHVAAAHVIITRCQSVNHVVAQRIAQRSASEAGGTIKDFNCHLC